MEKNISLSNVKIHDEMWSYYMDLVKNKVIPYIYDALNDRVENAEPSGAIRNFKIAAGYAQGEYTGRVFQDSDVAKWLEAVAYYLTWNPDAELEKLADSVIDIVVAAQHEDGYLNTYFTIKEPGKRWTNLYECHEMYCFGHLTEAAIAYYQATGKKKLLNAMIKYADLICENFGSEPGKLRGYDGHQECEIALVKLYKVTGEQKYLDLARFFLEERGAEPYYYDIEWERRGKTYYYPRPSEIPPSRQNKENIQAHKRPREQCEAVGHAVRFAYMATAMSDVAYETGDKDLLNACRRLWNSAVNKRMYITGAIGSTRHGEAFTFDYDLPNDRAYGETCASIGMVFFAYSMLKNEKKAEYADIMELELYNTILVGLGIDGQSFFYVNPLEVNPLSCQYDPDMIKVKPIRQKWFATACCPPNIARLISSLGKYIYSQTEETIYVHLYISSTTDFNVDGKRLTLINQSRYPWDGNIRFITRADEPIDTAIALRIPQWTEAFTVKVNGEEYINFKVENGYAIIQRQFKDGDTIELGLDVKPRFYYSNENVRYNAGKVALKAGPIVYCVEEIDNGDKLHSLLVDTSKQPLIVDTSQWPFRYNKIVVDGYREFSREDGALYTTSTPLRRETKVHFIPYFLWGNRNNGQPKEMKVWIRES